MVERRANKRRLTADEFVESCWRIICRRRYENEIPEYRFCRLGSRRPPPRWVIARFHGPVAIVRNYDRLPREDGIALLNKPTDLITCPGYTFHIHLGIARLVLVCGELCPNLDAVMAGAPDDYWELLCVETQGLYDRPLYYGCPTAPYVLSGTRYHRLRRGPTSHHLFPRLSCVCCQTASPF